MAAQTGAEAKAATIKALGQELGEQYSELWQEIALLYINWGEFKELFGKKSTRVQLLNKAAPNFFRMTQDTMWEAIVMGIARLTDPAHSMNNKSNANLTLNNLPNVIKDAALKAEVEKLNEEAKKITEFARTWRNKRIAHRDLTIALGGSAHSLPEVSLKEVDAALASFQAVLNAIAKTLMKSETRFDMVARHNGALHLLYLMDDGLRAQEARDVRFKAGDMSALEERAKDL